MNTIDILECAVYGRLDIPILYQLSCENVILDIKKDRRKIKRSLDEIMCMEDPEPALTYLHKAGFLAGAFHEVSAIVSLGDADGLHKDVWAHTMAVIRGVPRELDLRWAALFHDIGKAKTRRFNAGRVTFHNHDIVGARMFNDVCHRTRLFDDDEPFKRTVECLVAEHLRPASYNKSWTDSAVRRLVTECGDPLFFEKLMKLSRADLTTKNAARRKRCEKRADELETRVRQIITEDSKPRLPKGVMGRIIELSGRHPSTFAAQLKERMESMMNTGEIRADLTPDEYVDIGIKLIQQT